MTDEISVFHELEEGLRKELERICPEHPELKKIHHSTFWAVQALESAIREVKSNG